MRSLQVPGDSLVIVLTVVLRRSGNDLRGIAELRSPWKAEVSQERLVVAGSVAGRSVSLRFEVPDSRLSPFVLRGRFADNYRISGILNGSGFNGSRISLTRIR